MKGSQMHKHWLNIPLFSCLNGWHMNRQDVCIPCYCERLDSAGHLVLWSSLQCALPAPQENHSHSSWATRSWIVEKTSDGIDSEKHYESNIQGPGLSWRCFYGYQAVTGFLSLQLLCYCTSTGSLGWQLLSKTFLPFVSSLVPEPVFFFFK